MKFLLIKLRSIYLYEQWDPIFGISRKLVVIIAVYIFVLVYHKS